MDIQFLHDMRFVGFYRFFADAEKGGDLGYGMSFSDQLQNLSLPVGEEMDNSSFLTHFCLSNIFVDNLSRNGRAEIRIPLGDGPDCRAEICHR